MKIISDKKMATGKRRITIELDDHESIIAIRHGAHYCLGYPIEDIVADHIIRDAKEVSWCSIEQRWIS